MDGRKRTRIYSVRLRDAVRVAVASALLLGGHASAETPPPFEVQGQPQPITGPHKLRVQLDRSLPGQSVGVQPELLKPRARVLSVPRGPVVAVLAGNSDANPASPALTPNALHSVPSATGKPAVRLTIDEALETRGSVSFRKTALSEVVFLLSELWHVNIVAGENVSGEVSGVFHDAPLKEVLSAALTATGYSYRQTGSSLIVLPIDQVGSDDPDFVSDTIRLPSALTNIETTLEAAQLLLSDRGQMRQIGDSTVLVVDTAPRIARIRQLFTDLTPAASSSTGTPVGEQSLAATTAASTTPELVQSGIAYFTPQFTEAEEMGEPLREALGENVVVAVYSEENRIMIKGTPDDLKLASEAIRELDKPRPQVRITAMIYDVSLKEVERLGVDWSFRPHSRSLALSNLNDPDTLVFRNAVTASTALITDPSAPGAANFAISTINDTLNVDTLFQALDSSSEAKLLADPSITVGDRYEASIRIVQKIPILAADPVENSGVVFSQVQFEEAGVILNVKPRISRDGTIELTVQPEYSVVADFIENNPVIDSRTAQTTVRVADGQMFAIGGLRQKSIVETVKGVPCLKDLKYVGKLFRSHDTEVRESELIVFLTPELISPYCSGTLRQQYAGKIGSEQLDAIPHAEDVPATPCCKDPHCPNHFPRPRLNGGTQSLEMISGDAVFTVDPYETEAIEVIDQMTQETVEDHHQAVERYPRDETALQPIPDQSPNVVINDVFPPIHIDVRESQ